MEYGNTIRRAVGLVLVLACLAWITFAVDPAEPTPEPAPSDGDAASVAEQRMHVWIERAVASANPRLDAWTRERIARSVLRCGRDQGLEHDLVLAVLLVESSGRPDARSPKGAVGLMQVMPHMYRALDLPGGAAHLEANMEAGCILLADNIRRLGEERGISAYFWGNAIEGDEYLDRVRSLRAALARAPRPQGSASGG
jgi:hypothetical protein